MIRVQQEDFDVGTEVAALRDGDTGIGGIATFIGTVREMSGDQAISSMTLEHYPGMTEKALGKIEAEARDRWPLAGVTIIHRYGTLLPGDQIVLVITAAAHRQAAFDACQFLMDWLKTSAPFWKLEEKQDGARHWVDAKQTDNNARDRWNKTEPDPI